MKHVKVLLILLGVIAAGLSLAHTDEYLDTVQAPHGGQLRMSGPYHLELVVKREHLSVYVTDHGGQSVDTQSATATAIVLSAKVKTRVALSPAGDNVLRGSGPYQIEPGMKVVVRVNLPNQETRLARFTPLAKTRIAIKP